MGFKNNISKQIKYSDIDNLYLLPVLTSNLIVDIVKTRLINYKITYKTLKTGVFNSYLSNFNCNQEAGVKLIIYKYENVAGYKMVNWHSCTNIYACRKKKHIHVLC